MKAVTVVLLLCTSLGLAAPLIDEPVAELHLASGKVLYDARAKGFAAKTVLVKHREGAETVKYDQFPAEYQRQLLQKKPQPAPERQPSSSTQVSTAKLPASRHQDLAKKQPQTPVIITSTSIGPTFTTVEITNNILSEVLITPAALAAETASGKVVLGRHWVQVDSNGAISGSLSSQQTLGIRSTLSLNVVFSPLAAGDSISRVYLNGASSD